MRGRAFLGTLVLVSCGPSLDFRLAPDFNDDETAAIVGAAREWNAITSTSHTITFDGDSWYVEKVAPNGAWLGLTSRSRKSVKLVAKDVVVRQASYRSLVLHELGHALGLRHLCYAPNVPGDLVEGVPPCVEGQSLGVMDPINLADSFSALDLAECRNVGACE